MVTGGRGMREAQYIGGAVGGTSKLQGCIAQHGEQSQHFIIRLNGV